jgi:hypothetical protein
LSQGDLRSFIRAQFVTFHGRELRGHEPEFLTFFDYLKHQKFVRTKAPPAERNVLSFKNDEERRKYEVGIDRMVEKLGNELSKKFLKAVMEYDSDAIVEMANAVWFFKGFKDKSPHVLSNYQDPERKCCRFVASFVGFAVFGGMTGASFVATPERRGDWTMFAACRERRARPLQPRREPLERIPQKRFCWPNRPFGCKIQILALPLSISIRVFVVLPPLFGWHQGNPFRRRRTTMAAEPVPAA